MKIQLSITATLLAATLAGCGQQQTPPGDGRPLVKVSRTASDIPVYKADTHGEPIAPEDLWPGAMAVWEKIDPAPHIEAFHEANGHYPQDYAEFKSGVLEPNDIKFPENMPGGLIFCYDETNHKIVLVTQGN